MYISTRSDTAGRGVEVQLHVNLRVLVSTFQKWLIALV